MIKLFFITLLCVTLVFAELPLENFRNIRALDKPMTELHNARNFMNDGAKMVRRSAQGAAGAGAGAGLGGGFSLGGHLGGQLETGEGEAGAEAGFGFNAGGGFEIMGRSGGAAGWRAWVVDEGTEWETGWTTEWTTGEKKKSK